MRKSKTIVEYPKVSIITCVYNGDKYISKLLDSVLNMGYPNIEHIIVNDGSTDSTEDIVMKYAELYKNKENSNLHIKYIKQENKGLGGATNTGLKQIAGEYWTWINCDDWYEPGAFFEPINLMVEKPRLDYVQMNGYFVKPNAGHEKMVNSDNKIAFNNTKKLFKQYCYRHKDFRYLLYLCKVSSFKRINPIMQIYPSHFTQDIPLICQIFGVLKGDICRIPLWNNLLREDSFYNKISNNLWGDLDNMRRESIELLGVKKSLKRSLYALTKEYVYVDRVKALALNHHPFLLFRYYLSSRTYRKHIAFEYFFYFNHLFPIYFVYSLLKFARS